MRSELDVEEVLHVDQAHGATVGVEDGCLVDAVLAQEPVCVGRELVGGEHLRRTRHMRVDGLVQRVGVPALEEAAQVPVRDDADQRALRAVVAAGLIDDALAFCVENKLNMIVSGGTSTGKTVAARKILSHVPAEERIVTIEEAAELLPTQPNAVTLIANRDAEFQTADVLLTATLRMRPDRIILGEVRGKEAMTFLEAINTGHGGSMTTLHAETPQLAVQRLAIAALKTEIPMTYGDMIQYIENSIDVIIQAGRHDGKRGITEFYLPGATEIGISP